MHEPPEEPTEEELRAAFDEQMSRIRVEDVILQTVATLVHLGARHLGLTLTAEPGEEPPERDLDQARLAIDAVRALLPHTSEEQAEPIREALSQLQMAFAQVAPPGGADAGPDADAGVDRSPPPAPAEAGEPPPESDDAERAKARSKLWTPPGT